jgi:hypothetical protein
MFKCKRCGYESAYKHCLLRHLQSKTICDILIENIDAKILLEELTQKRVPELSVKCKVCSREFNCKSSMYKHIKLCKSNSLLSEISTLKNIVDNQQKKLDRLLKKTPDNTTNNTTNNTTTNNNTQNITNNIHVKLNDFGQENMSALPEPLISTLFMDLRFRELLANLHCDPNYPENQNIRIKSIKRNTMEIFRNNKWDIMTFTKGLTELLLQGHKIFKDYYKKDKDRILEEDMNEDEIKEILNQLDQIEKLNKEELRPLLVDLQMMLEEYRENGNAIIIV